MLTITKKKKTRYRQLKQQFEEFHKAHPEVYAAFVNFTFNRIEKGFKTYSAYAVIEQVRWHLAKVGGDGENEFKINNNFRPFYARQFMKDYPDRKGFFETRTQLSHLSPARDPATVTPAQAKAQ